LIFQSFKRRTPRQTAFGIVLLLFILSIIIRLPSLSRPISKHYEFNSAVILINIISWRQGGGGDHFHYTPVMNFQNAGDKFLPVNLGFDKFGNSIYLSFGPGWYVIPYFFYQLFHLPAIPIYLRILNLLFHLATVILFFFLLEAIIPSRQTWKYSIISTGCCFLIFTPGMLWFLGNGYVTTGIMLPFILGLFLVIHPMLQDPVKIRAGRLLLLGILVIILVYIDWYVLFLSSLCCLIALIKFRQSKKYGWLIFVLFISAISGVALIFFQFASYVGYEAVVSYWLTRSSERRMHVSDINFLSKLSYFLIYFLTCFLPLIILLMIARLHNQRKGIISTWSMEELLFVRIFAASLIFYNLVLFDWSAGHEFTILPWSLLLCFVTARFIGTLKDHKLFRGSLVLFMVCSIGQYYYLNRPGPISRDGTPYASFKQLGESLKRIPPDYTICLNLEQNPMVEYYAGRNILRLRDSLSSMKALKEIGIKKAVWVTQKNYQLENIKIIK
jgi:hypothetical protein